MAKGGERRPTIVYAEDEVFIRMTIAEELRDAGYEVLEASNGEEAMSLLESVARIDLLITDIRMPGSIDGIELADRLKARHPSMPIIITSSHLPEGAEAYAQSFLAKPYLTAAVVTMAAKQIGDTWRTRTETRNAS